MSNNARGGVYRTLYIYEKFGALQVGPKRLPELAAGDVLIKERSVALNIDDQKMRECATTEREYPVILGCEGAGEIQAVGEGVMDFKKGDKVFHQGFWKNDYATFQEYVLCPAEMVFKLPSNITLDQAAAIPFDIGTAAVPFYSQAPYGFGFKAPWDDGRTVFLGQTILIFGGTTGAGQYAIQLARLSGFSAVVTTGPLEDADLLKSLGATHVIDSNAPSTSFVDVIASAASFPLTFVYDAVGSLGTQQLGYDLLVEGGCLASISPPFVKKTEGIGKRIVHITGSLHLAGNRELGKALAKHLPSLIEAGEIIPNEIEIVPEGLNGVLSGLERLNNNLVGRKKLIIRPGETVSGGPPPPLPAGF